MKLVFASNYFNHHQKVLADEFIKIYGDDYAFVAFTPFNQKRLAIGYHDMNYEPCVFRAYESPSAMSEAQRMIDEAECVIVGGMPSGSISCVRNRLKNNKITFLFSERFFKGSLWRDTVRFMKYCIFSGGRREAKKLTSKFYLLCSGAFTAWDYSVCGLFRGKAYRWGYFPENKKYDNFDEVMSLKKHGSILWAGRFLEWKHPELAVMLAKNLREMGIKFNMKMIGSGELHSVISEMVTSLNLQDCVELTEAVPAEQVLMEMEASQIFLFTSDRGEGWGAVLNEAMGSGCAVAAGDKIGAVPYLIKNGKNGLIFRNKDINDLTVKVSELLREPVRIAELGRNAYETLTGEWSAGEAARRFIKLAETLNTADGSANIWEDGPCSIAPII
ncbi:MAG: glycosyltransferase [Synergistaceae bacterium]|nr:glycosyltransferase [Synergistaceae bacterium]